MRPVNRTLAALLGATAGMFVFAWALVPLYDLFCEVTGLNGKVTGISPERPVEERMVDEDRTLNVRFVVTRGDGIPWEFEPMQKTVDLHPGEERSVFFRVRNRSDERLAAKALPSVVPGLATQFLHKMECFCFKKQWLEPGQEAKLGMRFYFDTDLPAQYDDVVIAYTLYGLNAEEG